MAFGKGGGHRAITLDGDMFDPRGNVTGGYNESHMFFQTASEIIEVKKKIISISKQLAATRAAAEEIAKRSTCLVHHRPTQSGIGVAKSIHRAQAEVA